MVLFTLWTCTVLIQILSVAYYQYMITILIIEYFLHIKSALEFFNYSRFLLLSF